MDGVVLLSLAKHAQITFKTPTGSQLQMEHVVVMSRKFNQSQNVDQTVNAKPVKDVLMEYVSINVLQSHVLLLRHVLMVNALFQLHQNHSVE